VLVGAALVASFSYFDEQLARFGPMYWPATVRPFIFLGSYGWLSVMCSLAAVVVLKDFVFRSRWFNLTFTVLLSLLALYSLLAFHTVAVAVVPPPI